MSRSPSCSKLTDRAPSPPGSRHHNQPVHVPDGALVVGRILGPHSLSGEVRVELHTDFPERFVPGAILLLGDELQEIEVISARPHKSFMLIRFVGVESRTAAETLNGRWLYIPESDAVELDPGTYWIHDLIGMTVQTTDGLVLGTLKEVLATGANDVYVVRPAAGVNRDRDLLLPAIPEVVRAVDLEARRMTVELLPGLLET